MNSEEETFGRLLIRRLVANVQCAVCGEAYDVENVEILSHQDDLWVSSVICEHCRTQGLIFAIVKGDAVEADAVSELTPSERKAFDGMDALGMDDVLDVHNLLRDFHGDATELFEGADDL